MVFASQWNSRRDERGSIIVMTAILMSLLFLMVGLCIDVSRIYMMRTELQNAADAAALTAARELNSGTGGIDDAIARAGEIVNTRGFAKTGVNIAKIQFAANLNDEPYLGIDAAKANAANIRFVKVTTEVNSTSIIFAIGTLGTTHAESRDAVAGMSVGLNGICDFFPAAVALTDPNPIPGTGMKLKFKKAEDSLEDQDYVILDMPGIDTAVLTAGLPNFCKKLGDTITLTPGSNPKNGPENSGVGINTRFNDYVADLPPESFPPDSNVQENITASQYKNRTAVSPPNPNGPGKNDRRLLIAPIISLGTHPLTTEFLGWGVFFLKSKVPTDSSVPSEIGSIPVEYVGKALTGSGYGDPVTDPRLSIPVLYK